MFGLSSGWGGGLVRAWTVRGTIHTIPSSDYYAYIFGVLQNIRGPLWVLRAFDRYAEENGLPRRTKRIELLYQPLLDEIRGRSVTTGFICGWMNERLRKLGYKPGWSGFREMATLGLIVSAGRKGVASLFRRTDEWIAKPKREPERALCRNQIIRKHIGYYGPVSISDIRYRSNLPARDVEEAIRDIQGDLTKANSYLPS